MASVRMGEDQDSDYGYSDCDFDYDGADSDAGSRGDAPAEVQQARASASKKCAFRIIDATALKHVQVGTAEDQRLPGCRGHHRAAAAAGAVSGHPRGAGGDRRKAAQPPSRASSSRCVAGAAQDEAVDVVVCILSCKPSIARALLRFYRWDSEKIMSGYPATAAASLLMPWLWQEQPQRQEQQQQRPRRWRLGPDRLVTWPPAHPAAGIMADRGTEHVFKSAGVVYQPDDVPSGRRRALAASAAGLLRWRVRWRAHHITRPVPARGRRWPTRLA
jgi:hypothetical protein